MMRQIVVVALVALMVSQAQAAARKGSWSSPLIAQPRFAQVQCGRPGAPACAMAIDALKKEEMAMLQKGLPGKNGEVEGVQDMNQGEQQECGKHGERTPEEEALGLNAGASPCEVSKARKMMCKAEEECEENLVIEQENEEAERAELQEMNLNKQVAILERLISHAKDIQNAIPSKMSQLTALKKRLAAAEIEATAKQANGELEKQRAFLLEINNKITELKEKLEELEMTKERTEKTIRELEEEANGLQPEEEEEAAEEETAGEAASAAGEESAAGEASAAGSASGEGEGEASNFI